MNQIKCPYCDGSEIVADIRVSQTAEAGNIGLSFKTAMILVGTEPILAGFEDWERSVRARCSGRNSSCAAANARRNPKRRF
jgi:hypothetical protein